VNSSQQLAVDEDILSGAPLSLSSLTLTFIDTHAGSKEIFFFFLYFSVFSLTEYNVIFFFFFFVMILLNIVLKNLIKYHSVMILLNQDNCDFFIEKTIEVDIKITLYFLYFFVFSLTEYSVIFLFSLISLNSHLSCIGRVGLLAIISKASC
jgi:hypothetical protein